MFASRGVDSDTSSGEPDFPEPPPKQQPPKRPKFSFKSIFQPPQAIREVVHDRYEKEELKGLTPIEAAEVAAVSPKKRVRIVVDGDPVEDPDMKGEVKRIGNSAVAGAISSIVASKEKNRVQRKANPESEEMLTLIRKLIADSAADRRDPSKPNSPSAHQLPSPRDARDKIRRRPAPTLTEHGSSETQPADPPTTKSNVIKRRPTPSRDVKGRVEGATPASPREKVPFPSAPLPQQRQPDNQQDNAEHHLNRAYYDDAPVPERHSDRIPRKRGALGRAHNEQPAVRSAPPLTEAFDTADRDPFSSFSRGCQADQIDGYHQSDDVLPPLSYQPLRAYQLQHSGNGDRIFQPAQWDPRQQPRRLVYDDRSASQDERETQPAYDSRNESDQRFPIPTGADTYDGYLHSAPLLDASSGYPPPVYPHPPSLQPWQPYYPTLHHPQAHYPASLDHLNPGRNDRQSPGPVSAPIQPSERWSPLPIPWPSPRLRQSLIPYAKHEPPVAIDDLPLTPAPSVPRSPIRTGGKGLPGSMRGQIVSPVKTKLDSPKIVVKRSGGICEVDPYTSSKEVSGAPSPLERDPGNQDSREKDSSSKRTGRADTNGQHLFSPDDVDVAVRRAAKARLVQTNQQEITSLSDREADLLRATKVEAKRIDMLKAKAVGEKATRSKRRAKEKFTDDLSSHIEDIAGESAENPAEVQHRTSMSGFEMPSGERPAYSPKTDDRNTELSGRNDRSRSYPPPKRDANVQEDQRKREPQADADQVRRKKEILKARAAAKQEESQSGGQSKNGAPARMNSTGKVSSAKPVSISHAAQNETRAPSLAKRVSKLRDDKTSNPSGIPRSDRSPDTSVEAIRSKKKAEPGRDCRKPDPLRKETEKVKEAFRGEERANPAPTASVTWSKCLVSFATCIDLVNDLLSSLTSERNGKRNLEPSETLEGVLPRLVASLMTQKDMVESMRGIFGQEYSQAMVDLTRHMSIVKSFLMSSKPHNGLTGDKVAKGLHTDNRDSLHTGRIHVVLDHLLHLSDYFTPSMLTSLRKLAEDWRDDRLSSKRIIHTIMTAHHELSSVCRDKEKQKADDKTPGPPIGRILVILEQLLGHLSPEEDDGRTAEVAEPVMQPPMRLQGASRKRPIEKSPETAASPMSSKRSLRPEFVTREGGKPVAAEHPRREKQRHTIKDKISEQLLHVIESRPAAKGEPQQRRPHHRVVSPTTASTSRDDRERKHSGLRGKVSDIADKVGDKLKPTHHATSERKETVIPPKSPGLRIMTEDMDEPELQQEARYRENNDQVHPKMEEPDLHLPSATQDFLEGNQTHNRPYPSGTKKSTIVTPSKTAIKHVSPAPNTDQSAKSWSSDSRYSDTSSVGTVESDEEAEQLLGMADSGPGAAVPESEPDEEEITEDSSDVEQGKGEPDEEEKPDENQVKRAEEVLLTEDVEEVKKEDRKTERERREERLARIKP